MSICTPSLHPMQFNYVNLSLTPLSPPPTPIICNLTCWTGHSAVGLVFNKITSLKHKYNAIYVWRKKQTKTKQKKTKTKKIIYMYNIHMPDFIHSFSFHEYHMGKYEGAVPSLWFTDHFVSTHANCSSDVIDWASRHFPHKAKLKR